MLTEAEVRAIKARAEASAPADDLTDANIVFLDNARTDMLALCDEALRLQAQEKELQERLDLLDDLAAGRQQMLLEVTTERDALRESLARVHRRMVTDYYTGTSPDSPHWWSCRVCTWSWKAGDPELHEPSCPVKPLKEKP